jgi:hypothetical protein
MRYAFISAAFCLLSLTSGCACHKSFIDSRLFFGLQTTTGNIPTDTLQAFIDSVITPRFPDGLTRYDAEGQWKDGKGAIVKEKSVVIEILHTATPETRKKIEEIRIMYKKKFGQESVLLVEDRLKVSF